MRLTLAAASVSLGLLSLTSCSDSSSRPVAENSEKNPFGHGRVEDSKAIDNPEKHEHSAPGHDHDSQVSDLSQRHDSDSKSKHTTAGHAHGAHHHGHAAHKLTPIDNAKKIAIGDKVPDFELTINDKRWKLSELQKNSAMTVDGTLVLTFWCSFCHSCRHVEHQLDELAREQKGKVAVIALDASAGETSDGVADFAKKHELTFPIALDTSGATLDIFGTQFTTTTVIIDKAGTLRYRGQFKDGSRAYAQEALRAILGGKEVTVRETALAG